MASSGNAGADALFSLATQLQGAQRLSDAAIYYRRAIRAGLDRVEEAYSNLGNIYSELNDVAAAEQCYRQAIQSNSEFLPAIFNLALLSEELGRRKEAISLYGRVLEVDPGYSPALVQLAYLSRGTSQTDLICRIDRALGCVDDVQVKSHLLFAKAKLLDDTGRYAEAGKTYRSANRLASDGRQTPAPEEMASGFARLEQLFSKHWITEHQTSTNFAPVFICGMYRSGSTLLEHQLDRHPNLQAGGELVYLPQLIGKHLRPYPSAVSKTSTMTLTEMASAYQRALESHRREKRIVLDKRPDNFLHIGLIKTLFPKALILHTVREVTDNCLSIYFQPFDRSVYYATDLESIYHYRRCHDRLMRHWSDLFPTSILEVEYESMVADPAATLRSVQEFLGLAKSSAVVGERNQVSRVRTASLWQVRQKIHTRSLRRFKNYPDLYAEIERARLAQTASS